MLDGRFRPQIETWTTPIGRSVKKAGIPADLITVVGVVMSIACAVAIAMGALRLGLLLMILTGIPDLLDGAVAKASGTTGPRGAFFDSVSDRLTDGLLFGAVAWYFTTTSNGPLPMLPVAVLVSASLVSYIRAKADALGFDAHVGVVERAERFVLLGFGLLFDRLLVATLVVMLVLNCITAGQRFLTVWKQASKPRVGTIRRTKRRSHVVETNAADRWRARRLAAQDRARTRRSL